MEDVNGFTDTLKVGNRVYYTDNGPNDTGTVTGIDADGYYHVDWDYDNEDDVYKRYQLYKIANG